MKILELTNYSAGVCGVWARVKEEAVRLARHGHEVRVYSSNLTKGSDEIANQHDKLERVKILRFSAKKLGGESFMKWDFEREAISYAPDVIIAHSYRHIHTTKALDVARKIKCKVFLVTHAPFSEDDSERSFLATRFVRFYDKFIGPKIINKFDKIITITKWELPFLFRIGAERKRIVYIPNGIPEEFFSEKQGKEDMEKILFLGRIHPVKDIETLLKAMSKIKNKDAKLEIVGPAEKEYKKELEGIIKELGLKKRIEFKPAVYDLREKIKKIDSARIFVLPSKREGMPQSLIEAMARERIVIASDTLGSSELIDDKQNGFLFEIENADELAKEIDGALRLKGNMAGIKARKSVEQFSWDKIIGKIENIL